MYIIHYIANVFTHIITITLHIFLLWVFDIGSKINASHGFFNKTFGQVQHDNLHL